MRVNPSRLSNPRRTRLGILVVGVALTASGCGGDDAETADSGVSGAQGPVGAESDITAEEFLQKLLPEKQVAIEAVIATEPECEGVKAEPAFVLVVSDAASEAEPRTPLTELVVAEC